jgi:hypothetical protein
MTKKNLNREIKDAAAPAIEVVRLLVEQMRQQGQSDAETLAALDRLERDNPAKVDADVMAVVISERSPTPSLVPPMEPEKPRSPRAGLLHVCLDTQPYRVNGKWCTSRK